MKYSNEELSKQLRCPEGAEARQIGENMFQSNCNMIFETINTLDICPNSKVFEIGFGNGMHLSYLFERETSLKYQGVEISQAMVDESNLNNQELVKSGRVAFINTSESDFSFIPSSSFNYCFSVNTLYFWNNPQRYFDEIYRILERNGAIAISFMSKSFGEGLPFTQAGFTFYETGDVERFLFGSGFINVRSVMLTEDAISKNDQKVERSFVILSANKD